MKRRSHPRNKRTTTKSVLRLPDLEHAKTAVLNSLTSRDAQGVIVMQSMSSSTGIARNRGWRSIELWSCVIALIWNPVSSRPAPSISVLAQCGALRTKLPTAAS